MVSRTRNEEGAGCFRCFDTPRGWAVSTFERMRRWLAASLGVPEEMIEPSSTLGDLFRLRPRHSPASSEDDVRPPAFFVDDISPDSLDIVELTLSLEEEFELELPEMTAETLSRRLLDNRTTVQQIADWMDGKSD
jgi:acyl carrier protein